ncbi:Zn-ribbon domain-containing OB-fold protein [Brevibacterium spongiae]|uniref:OB-fold domain-containing protein n=1 Tax=Brevibacterium spongiae TaxID=2909672 RepID=A0ABY5SQJ5_9MICO|nr:OB-fold domain-containing protein [Brevibacterium spongiae]UVI36425.1 OB-fold domain-containing protein [Brevibacterium spongiae]
MPTTGEVYTYTVMYRPFHPWFKDQLLYGVVEVEDGIQVIGRYVGEDPEDLTCGQRMEAVFDDLGEHSGSIAWRRTRDRALS